MKDFFLSLHFHRELSVQTKIEYVIGKLKEAVNSRMAAGAPDSWEQFDNNGFNMPVMSEAALQLKSLSRFLRFAPRFKGEMLSYYQEAIFNSSPQKKQDGKSD